MSVFEELIDELKEENLLEETIFSLNRTEVPSVAPVQHAVKQTADPHVTVEKVDDPVTTADEIGSDHSEIFSNEPADEREAYRKRAMDEVSTLQMVEHVLSGIEREHMKMAPAAYDDLEVKKALHRYVQFDDADSEAQRQLLKETEKWFSSLANRDSNISVANVRRFCENSRPVLSSQALIALARFYRNSPFTEAVRGKFDFVMTRLFSRELEEQKRKLLFGNAEMLGHIKTLYANWSSLSLEDPGGSDSPAVMDAVTGFEQFVRESEAAVSFDDLITSDFFNRIRLFKESAQELFMEPSVTGAAIECNVRIGNRFIDLIRREREAVDQATVEEKYGYTYDTIISGAASKTLLLLEVLRSADDVADGMPQTPTTRPVTKVIEFERAPVEDSKGMFKVNKWLIAATVLALLLSAGIYYWSENAAATESSIEIAPSIDLGGTDLTAHLRDASKTPETLYAVTQPTWDALSEDEQKALLSKAVEFARAKGMKKVNLLNSRGRTVAFASDERLEVLGPQ